ncbi:MAG: protein kinase [Chloroflexaceae bacterium]|nr:protein kinase [Chloroflexaceae bacterium]
MEQTVLNQRYELKQRIGEGGMATVYQGFDLRLNRRVAIKVLHRHYVHDPDFLARFRHEAQAAAILSHPNIVNVYDVDQDGDHHYIVMEYVDGVNLKMLINRHSRLLVATTVAVGEEVARGLEAAHRVGLVHRDIKPANIIVTPEGHAVITDFGIAKSHLSTTLTQTGVTFGTVDYLSPEQAQGRKATPSSDIYALGVTLYEMLTGRLPFTGESPVTVAMQHVSAPPPPLRQFNPQVPPNLEALVLQTLEKEPHLRPASAQELGQKLRAYRVLADQQTLATPQATSLPVRATPALPGEAPGNQPGSYRNGEDRSPSLPYPVAIRAPHHPGMAGSHAGGGAGGPMGLRMPHQPAGNTIPPPRSNVSRAPQQQGIGCGILIVGMLVLVGVIGLVLAFSSGMFDSMLAGFDDQETRSSLVLTRIPAPTGEPTALPLPTPTLTPTLTPTPTAVPTVVVPNIIGKTEQEARQLLEAANLVPVDGGVRHDDVIPAGAVVEQNPPAGTVLQLAGADPSGNGDEFAPRPEVTYLRSQGPAIVFLEVPNLTGLHVDHARMQAEQTGLVVETSEEASTFFSEGFVTRQEPAPGHRVRAGEVVHLFVSVGDRVRVPDLRWMSEEEAKQRLAALDGLFYSWSDMQGPDKLGGDYYKFSPGTVVSMEPGQDEWVPRGTGITLGVREY